MSRTKVGIGAIYWLAKMLHAGERVGLAIREALLLTVFHSQSSILTFTPSRRIVIFAGEDVSAS